MPNDWSHEETNDPLHADRRNFYKVEKWSRDGQRVNEMLFAGNSLAKAQRIFERFIKRRPRSRLTIRQRTPGVAGVASGMKLFGFHQALQRLHYEQFAVFPRAAKMHEQSPKIASDCCVSMVVLPFLP